MGCSVRRIFIQLLTIVCFFMSIYFFYSKNNTNCDDQTHVFRYMCKSLNFKALKSVRKVGKYVSMTYCRVKNLLQNSDKNHTDIDIDELIEKYSKKQFHHHKLLNETNQAKKRVGPRSSWLLPSSIKVPTAEWLDSTEGKKYSDYGDNTCGDNLYRKTLTRIFRKWIEITRKLNITYFLTCGSLLGAWRNGDIIPYDIDIDVLIDQRDAIKLEPIRSLRNFSPYDGKLRLVLQEDWRLPYYDRRMLSCDSCEVPAYEGECSFQKLLGRVLKDGLHIDIFDYKNVDGILYDPSSRGQKYNVSDVFPLKKCRFLGQVTYCPKNPKAVLYQFYGKNISNLAPNKICREGKWIEKD